MSKKNTQKSKPKKASRATGGSRPRLKTKKEPNPMKKPSINHHCPVCGYADLAEPPRNATGGASLEICPSCGFQFGVDDDDKGITHDQHRERWIAEGMPWRSKGKPVPKNWLPQTQLANLALKMTLGRVRGRPPKLSFNF